MVNHNHIIQLIEKTLFAAEDRRLQGWIDKLATANKEAQKLPEPVGFMHAGTYYRPSWIGTGRGMPRPKRIPGLSFHLADDARLFERDAMKIRTDKKFVSQMVFNLLGKCENLQDVRDTLPECLISAVPGLSGGFERTREAAYTIQDNERAMRQYNHILPQIEFYVVARLIY